MRPWLLAPLLIATPAAAGPLDAFTADATCIVEANSVVHLSSPTQGTLSEVTVERGQAVKAGDVVARLESSVEQATYEEAARKAASDVVVRAKQADRDNAYGKLARIRSLAETKIASVDQLQDAQTTAVIADFAVEQAQFDQQVAEVEARRLKAVVDQRAIRSPVSGVVTRVGLHAGEFADPTVPIVVISENQPLRAEVYLPSDAYPLVTVGLAAEITLVGAVSGTFPAEVSSKDAEIDPASGTFQAVLKLDNADGAIPSGLRCTAKFGTD